MNTLLISLIVITVVNGHIIPLFLASFLNSLHLIWQELLLQTLSSIESDLLGGNWGLNNRPKLRCRFLIFISSHRIGYYGWWKEVGVDLIG